MMTKKPKILAFTGSLREHSYNRRVLKTAMRGAENAGAKVILLDLNDFPMPVYNPDLIETEGFPPAATALQNLLLEYDGLMIASPEYNASLPAGLKNMIDWTSRANGNLKLGDCYRGKVAAIMTASPGNFGGIRCLRHLRDILTLLLVHTLPVEIAVPRVGTLFEAESHEINDAVMRGTLENLGALLAETVRKLHGKTDAVPAK